ncbi:hypothetical protein R1flu_013463 [Riccia fluitans]|uniref:Uncharacterized protein n=1 Tax=Riccia fluitans TaxID=41844 RepID=A0ABD1YH01_9MARC
MTEPANICPTSYFGQPLRRGSTFLSGPSRQDEGHGYDVHSRQLLYAEEPFQGQLEQRKSLGIVDRIFAEERLTREVTAAAFEGKKSGLSAAWWSDHSPQLSPLDDCDDWKEK